MNKRPKRPHGLAAAIRDPDAFLSDTHGIGGILARLWRTILLDLGVSPNRYEILLADAVNLARRGLPQNRITRHITRGNLRRELDRPSMTFKVFMKGLRFLRCVRVRFAVELTFASGKSSLHSVDVDLGNAKFAEEMNSPDQEKDHD